MAVSCIVIPGSVQYRVTFQKTVIAPVHNATPAPSTHLVPLVWPILLVGGVMRGPTVLKVITVVHTIFITARTMTGHTAIAVKSRSIVIISLKNRVEILSNNYKVENALVIETDGV